MKLSEENIETFRIGFSAMSTKPDLLVLLNKAKQMLYGVDCKPFDLHTLTYFSNPQNAKKRYKEFLIPKKSGGVRKINAPVKSLKHIQKCLNLILNAVYIPRPEANGFILGKSIVTNANIHTQCRYVYNIDLKDFFHSIELHRVKAVLKLPPFNLHDNKEPLAFMIANLCCEELEVLRPNDINPLVTRPVLPQGAPTSPTLTNIIAQRLDRRLKGLAKRFNANYSRYADDITFSANTNVFETNQDFDVELKRIINIEGFDINFDKVRLQKSPYRQEVTGLCKRELTMYKKWQIRMYEK